MSKIKIWSNGLSKDTKIRAVDGDGVETPITLVESINFELPKDARVGRLRMGFCFGNEVELEVPVDDHAVGRLKEIGPAWAELRTALRGVPVGGAFDQRSEWFVRLYLAACAMAGMEVRDDQFATGSGADSTPQHPAP